MSLDNFERKGSSIVPVEQSLSLIRICSSIEDVVKQTAFSFVDSRRLSSNGECDK